MTKFSNKQADEVILGALRDIATGYVRPDETRYGRKMFDPSQGICGHVEGRVTALRSSGARAPDCVRTTRRLRYLMQRWPESSHEMLYPVPSLRPGVSAREAFEQHEHNLWDKRTAYGKARWRLLSFLIRTLEGEA